MNQYSQSAYRNTAVKKNIISLSDKRVYDNFGTWACVIVILMALSLAAVSTAMRPGPEQPAQPAIVNTYLSADYCMTCHTARSEPAIKNLKQYKEAHPALSQKRLLQDLVATTGANP